MKELLQTIKDTIALQRRKRIALAAMHNNVQSSTIVELMRLEEQLQSQYKQMQLFFKHGRKKEN